MTTDTSGEQKKPAREILVARQVYYEGNVQVLAYEDEELDRVPALGYDPAASHQSEVGDPVYLYGRDGVVNARVTSAADRSSSVSLDETSYRSVQSGSPVVSSLTGEVIGVVRSKEYNPDTTSLLFQNLQLPEEAFAEPDPRTLPLTEGNAERHRHAMFGEEGESTASEVLEALEKNCLPLAFPHFGVGSTQQDLNKIRIAFPGSDADEKNSREHLYYYEQLPLGYLIESVQVGMLGRTVTEITVTSKQGFKVGEASYAEKAALIARFLAESMGAPDRIYKKIFPSEGKGFLASGAVDFLYLEWKREQDVLQLELKNSEEYGYRLEIIIRGENAGRETGLRKHKVEEYRQDDDKAVDAEICRQIVKQFFSETPTKGEK